MKRVVWGLRLLVVGVFITTVGSRPLSADQPKVYERVWEVVNKANDSIVPDIFYADSAQNEQMMPTATFAQRNMIDRLIYPTIGHPNLVVQDASSSTLDFVLRLETDALKSFSPKRKNANEHWNDLTLKQDANNYLAFYLVSSADRAKGEAAQALGSSGIKIPYLDASGTLKPGFALQVHRFVNQYPQAFRNRETLHFSADGAALKGIPSGLYDARFELVVEGKLVAYEFQYNAVRVFPEGPKDGVYHALNVTDSQVSISDILEALIGNKSFRQISLEKLVQFVDYVNSTMDPEVASSAFITFNGDLHNGGSPATLSTRGVSRTYLEESRAIINVLKNLKFPIFLLPGNHDGYVATGQRPSLIASKEGDALFQQVVQDARKEAGQTLSQKEWTDYMSYLKATEKAPGGKHVDIFGGRFVRRAGIQSFDRWEELPEIERNKVLYDGFNYWRRNYGPLYYSFSFGSNRYVAVNSYDLRQHRRTGWGMYTVNYGGGVSAFQMDWLRWQLEHADERGEDIVVLAHHDPRGGHKGEDFPYYYKQIDYEGMSDSFANYVKGEIFNPVICDKVPQFLQGKGQKLSCLHDGLQEWMLADEEFDCDNADLKSVPGSQVKRCDTSLFKPKAGENLPKKHAIYSGYQFIDKLASIKNFRTLLLGHTHYHSVEVLKGGDEIIPDHVILSPEKQNEYKELESSNPLRLFSRLIGGSSDKPTYSDKELEARGIYRTVAEEAKQLGKVVELVFGKASNHNFERVIQGSDQERELAVLRLTSVAKMTGQKTKKDQTPMFGFSVFRVDPRKDQRGYALPQINHVFYYQNTFEQGGSSSGKFEKVAELDLDRTQRAHLHEAGAQGLVDKYFTPGE